MSTAKESKNSNQLGHHSDWSVVVKKLILLFQSGTREDFIKKFELYDQGRKRFASRALAAGFKIQGYSLVKNYDTPTHLLSAIYKISRGTSLSEIAEEIKVEVATLIELRKIIMKTDLITLVNQI